MAAREEQETIVSMGRIDDYMTIWTNNIVHARALDKEPRAKLITPGITALNVGDHLEAGFGLEYRVEAEDARILNVFARKRKPMTEAEKKAAGERLRKARGAA